MKHVRSHQTSVEHISAESINQSDFLHLGLSYGPLIRPIHQMIVSGRIPGAVVIYGPRGVGKKTLCRLIASQILGIHSWLTGMLYLRQAPVPDFKAFSDIFDAPAFQQSMLNDFAPKPGNAQERGKGQISLSEHSTHSKDVSDAPVPDCRLFNPGTVPDSPLFRAEPKERVRGDLAPDISEAASLLASNHLGAHPFGRPMSLGQAREQWRSDQVNLVAHPEYLWLEPGSGMDQVRSLLQKLSYTRHSDTPRIVILPEAQSLTVSTSNALLKCIESPPPRTFFFLTASGSILKTLASRCISYTMAPLTASIFQQVFTSMESPYGTQGSASHQSSDRDLLFKMTQGCLGRIHYWQERMPWVKQGWDLLSRSALGECMIPDDWLKMGQSMGESVWDFLYIWGRSMYDWSYQQGFFWHWDAFWSTIWAMVQDHQIYHTDIVLLWQTICARIYGFHGHYRVLPMPIT